LPVAIELDTHELRAASRNEFKQGTPLINFKFNKVSGGLI